MCKALAAICVQTMVLFLSISASAQTTPDAQAILRKVNETYRNLKSFQFEYKTVSESKTEREELTSSSHTANRSRIAALRPDRIHAEVQDASSSVTFVADGQSVWMYSSELNAFTKRAAGTVDLFAVPKSTDARYEAMARWVNSKLAEYARLAAEPRNLTLMPNETLAVGGRQIECYVLTYSRGSGSNKTNTRYWIDRERYLVLREVMDSTYRSSSGSVTQSTRLVNFTTATINEPVADAVFSYTPPQNAVEI